MRKARLALAGLLLVAAVVVAAGPPPAKPVPKLDPAALNDQLDYLFLASDRPVLLRIHVRLGDKPYAQNFHVWMDKFFDWFDKNKDGSLDAKEVARLPQPRELLSHLGGGVGEFFGGGRMSNLMPLIDTNKDGKVSRAELRAYYAKNDINALRPSQNNSQATEAEKLNKALYARLNKKKDGKLTRDDAGRFPELMAKLDENEDELIGVAEVNTRVDSGFYGFVEFDPYGRRPVAASTDYGLIDLKATPKGELVKKLVTAYDRNKDGKLSATEIGLPRADFAALDRNSDGQLDTTELAAFFTRGPDLAIRAKVGPQGAANTVVSGLSKWFGQKKPTQADRAELLPVQGRAAPLAKQAKRVNGDHLRLTLGDSSIAVQVSQGFANYSGAKSFYLRQFDTIANKKEGIDRKQAMGDFYVQQIFAQADQNGDDKLTKKELGAYLDLLNDGGGTCVTLSLSDQGRSLFQVVDANRDNSLSIRELRTAWERIKPLCKDKQSLQTKDLPRSLSVSIHQGMSNNRFAPPAVFVGGMGSPAPPRSGNAPLWFRKMDRNNDGDISPKEWLGTEEEFREIDDDGDGLISAAEALKFEAKKKSSK